MPAFDIQFLIFLSNLNVFTMPSKNIPLRRLGRDGPEVPALGYGLISLAGLYGSAPNDEERFAVLDHAVEIGETFWDSSE
jgi:hypothetical protein